MIASAARFETALATPISSQRLRDRRSVRGMKAGVDHKIVTLYGEPDCHLLCERRG